MKLRSTLLATFVLATTAWSQLEPSNLDRWRLEPASSGETTTTGKETTGKETTDKEEAPAFRTVGTTASGREAIVIFGGMPGWNTQELESAGKAMGDLITDAFRALDYRVQRVDRPVGVQSILSALDHVRSYYFKRPEALGRLAIVYYGHGHVSPWSGRYETAIRLYPTMDHSISELIWHRDLGRMVGARFPSNVYTQAAHIGIFDHCYSGSSVEPYASGLDDYVSNPIVVLGSSAPLPDAFKKDYDRRYECTIGPGSYLVDLAGGMGMARVEADPIAFFRAAHDRAGGHSGAVAIRK